MEKINISGYDVIVDIDKARDIDFSKVYISNSRGNLYARHRGKGKSYIYLHRMLLNAEDGQVVDHINGNTLDNRVENLRLGTHRDNMCNRVVRKRKYPRGVFKKKDKKRLKAQITVNGKAVHLGYFDCPLMAHLKYVDARSMFMPSEYLIPRK